MSSRREVTVRGFHLFRTRAMVAPMITAPLRVAVLYAQTFPANLAAPKRSPYPLCDRWALR